MSDTKQSTEVNKSLMQGGKEDAKPTAVRIRLKDREYRRLCEAAHKQGYSTQELVERCVRKLIDS